VPLSPLVKDHGTSCVGIIIVLFGQSTSTEILQRVQSIFGHVASPRETVQREALDIAFVLKDLNAQQAQTLAQQRLELAHLHNRIVGMEQLLKPDAPTP
jgi:hypothetical protein